MSKQNRENGKKNLIAERLISIRKDLMFSQRELANELQLHGIDMDKNVITRIETNKRYVSDIELKALANFFKVSYEYLIDGEENNNLEISKNDTKK
ncbi:MAG: helix-turn-helix transcriptional regulator [Bacillota bacterium]|nr:helix-turn-helix transcriptional regulator [Bacillota bacterium]